MNTQFFETLLTGTAHQDTNILLIRLFMTALIGLIIGMERERSHTADYELFAGMRTFSLIALLGFLSLYFANIFSIWIFIVTLAGIIAFVIVSYIIFSKIGDYGGTTDISIILTFMMGALIYLGQIHLVVATTVLILLLLSMKFKFKSLLGKITNEDVITLIKFTIITAIILPLLPDKAYGPFQVLNPRHIWFVIVLIASINFIGYLLMRFLGEKKGILLTGMIGGLFSSTAVAWSFSQKSRKLQTNSQTLAIAILLASSIMFARVLFLVYILNSLLSQTLYIALLILLVTGVLTSALMYSKVKNKTASESIEVKNPLNLAGAIKFGILYATILLFVNIAQTYFGNMGIYIASALSGLTDVDAITISMANLSKDSITLFVAKNAIIIAALSNTLVKYFITLFLGNRELKKYSSFGFGALFLCGIAYLILVNII